MKFGNWYPVSKNKMRSRLYFSSIFFSSCHRNDRKGKKRPDQIQSEHEDSIKERGGEIGLNVTRSDMLGVARCRERGEGAGVPRDDRRNP